jgi:hypothetical protein
MGPQLHQLLEGGCEHKTVAAAAHLLVQRYAVINLLWLGFANLPNVGGSADQCQRGVSDASPSVGGCMFLWVPGEAV